mgnify:CR=1 FL=1
MSLSVEKSKGSLCERGVGLWKDELTFHEEAKLRKDLMVKAFCLPNAMQQTKPFPIYRESTKKIYVPRFYGEKEFGISIQVKEESVSKYKVEEGALDFKGGMRPYQENIVGAYMKEAVRSGCGLLEIPCGRGKCLGYNTPILMYNGKKKMVQDVMDGDVVMGDDGNARYVSGVTKGRSKMYRIRQNGGGMDYRVNDVHILTLLDTFTNEVVDLEITRVLIDTHTSQTKDRYKGIRYLSKTQYVYTHIEIVEDSVEDDYYGFQVDGNHRFVLGDGTITHNTVMALNIMSKLKVKTLVIVHKEFLLNQWIERIEQFLPNAKVGRIQGKVIDIDGKDIVIGMLQSLSMKTYEKGTFSSFGLSVIDECHHISAEVFSRSLFKIVTPYMLGLSATMERKDQLTFVFKMFLGEVVYKEKREGTDEVEVRSILYESIDDPEYSNVEYNFKGQTHYSKMIKKLCEYSYRTEFLVKVVEDIMREHENEHEEMNINGNMENIVGEKRQLMILAHNKSLLYEIESSLKKRNVDKTIGYYVGGMKEVQLKETEKNDIILATYAMAEEALDIKSLSALLLATPKTDVTQAVGRILRIKHKYPLVVDIVDEHDIFKNQWTKRKRYYSKCNYKIIQTKSLSYNTDTSASSWKTITRGRGKGGTKKQNMISSNEIKTNNDAVQTSSQTLQSFFEGKFMFHIDTD